jgi:hypothetical protein
MKLAEVFMSPTSIRGHCLINALTGQLKSIPRELGHLSGNATYRELSRSDGPSKCSHGERPEDSRRY